MRFATPLATMVAAGLVVLLGASGVSAASADTVVSAKKGSDNILRIPVGGGGQIDSMNPFILLNQASADLAQIEYESLVIQGAPDGLGEPDLAEKWTTKGTTWTYTLRPDLKWSDGKPLTADDVAWTYNAIMTNPKLAVSSGGTVDNIDSVKAVDKDTVTIVTKTAQAINPGYLWIVPKHIWSKLKAPESYANTKDVVGSGPFVMSAYSRGVSAHMKANPHNWRGAPHLDGIEVINYKNKDAAVLALKAGEIDLVGKLTNAQYESFANAEGIKRVEGAPTRYLGLSINPGSTTSSGAPMGDGNEALKDVVVRRAIRQALDTQQLVEKVMGGHGGTGPEILSNGTKPYFSEYKDIAQPYSPDAANKALDDAGYKKGPDGYRLDKSGKVIDLRLEYDGSASDRTQSVTFIQPWLKAIGIKATPKPVSSDQGDQDHHTGNYDLYITGWGNPIDPDFLLFINTCGARAPQADGTGNGSADNWCDPAFDKLYKAQHVELDQDKRTKLVQDALSIHYKAAVLAVLYYPVPLEAYNSNRVTGLTQSAVQGDFLNYQQFYKVKLVGQQDAADSQGGLAWPWIVGIVVLLIVVIGGAVILVVRRRSTATDRE
jgi:peptide/nickel transport system substrate-binding protein